MAVESGWFVVKFKVKSFWISKRERFEAELARVSTAVHTCRIQLKAKRIRTEVAYYRGEVAD